MTTYRTRFQTAVCEDNIQAVPTDSITSTTVLILQVALTSIHQSPGVTFRDALQAAPEHQREECKLASHHRQGLAGSAIRH